METAADTSAGGAGRSAEAAAERGARSLDLLADRGDATTATAPSSSLASVATEATTDIDAWRERGSGDGGQIALLAALSSLGGRSLKFLGSVLKPAAAADSAEIRGFTSTNPWRSCLVAR